MDNFIIVNIRGKYQVGVKNGEVYDLEQRKYTSLEQVQERVVMESRIFANYMQTREAKRLSEKLDNCS